MNKAPVNTIKTIVVFLCCLLLGNDDKRFVAYLPLRNIYLLQKRSSVRGNYVYNIRRLSERKDVLVDLPSVFYRGREFVALGTLLFDKNDKLISAEIRFSIGSSVADTMSIKKRIMTQFKPEDSVQSKCESYFFDTDNEIKYFVYNISYKN